MKHVVFPASGTGRSLSFYLAAEEYLAANYRSDDLFFMWQVPPTVIVGRNQLLATEVNLDYCRKNGIRVNRRKSGGGCVFADMNNIMFSHITSVGGDTITTVFDDYIARVASFISSLGMKGTISGRNDVLIDGLKVSGNAFYRTHGRDIVHGTMLFRLDPKGMMEHAITPSPTKLQSKGVQSVRSRVTTVAEHRPDIDIEEFKTAAALYMTTGELTLTDADVRCINQIETTYDNPDWIYDSNPRFNVQNSHRFDGVGEFNLTMSVSNGIIDNVNLTGDFFLLGDLDNNLLALLKGIHYEIGAVRNCLGRIDLSRIIAGLTCEMLEQLMFDNSEN